MRAVASSTFTSFSSYASADVILIDSVTHLHVGSGKVSGEVDLPVQRDEFGFPCIYSSSLKGALKSALSYAAAKQPGTSANWRTLIWSLMGPDPEPEESFESSVTLLDAYLLAMPVRSLKGVYAYVTTPTLLRRFVEFLELAKSVSPQGSQESEKGEAGGAGAGGAPKEKLNLEDYIGTVRNIVKEAESLASGTFLCLESQQHLCNKVQIEEMGG